MKEAIISRHTISGLRLVDKRSFNGKDKKKKKVNEKRKRKRDIKEKKKKKQQ